MLRPDKPISSYHPPPIATALDRVAQLRGFHRVKGHEQLVAAWKDVAGADAEDSRPVGIQNGVLRVGVSNPVLMAELSNFRESDLLDRLRSDHAHLKIKALKFQLLRTEHSADEEAWPEEG